MVIDTLLGAVALPFALNAFLLSIKGFRSTLPRWESLEPVMSVHCVKLYVMASIHAIHAPKPASTALSPRILSSLNQRVHGLRYAIVSRNRCRTFAREVVLATSRYFFSVAHQFIARSVPQPFEAAWYLRPGKGPLPPSSSPTSGPSSIAFPDVCAYLEIYHHKLYPVWPVVDRLALAEALGLEMRNPEICAILAFSVCAATGAQLNLNEDTIGALPSQGMLAYMLQPMTDRFATEAERYRSMYDHRERISVPGILIPFFLHHYYCKRNRQTSSTLLLREAITMCQLLELDKKASYPSLEIEEQRHRRKIFWLLFVTERARPRDAKWYGCRTIKLNKAAPC